MAKFLDQTGLAYFWGKLKALIPTKTSELTNDSGYLTSPNIPYLTCATAAGTAAKTTTLVSGKFTSADLVAGAQVLVKFAYANSVANPTISINGTTAKSIKRYGTTAPSTSATSSWNANEVVLLVYDGTYWMLEGWINTVYSAMSEAEVTAGTSTTARLITPARVKEAVELWETPNPTKTSDLTNDSGFITSAPVSSVNNKTGAVSLTYSDVGAAASSHEHDASDITSGTLSAARGGTGQTSVSAAANAFMVSLNTQNATSDVTDNTLIATSANTGETNTWYRRPASKLWNYIKGKSDALYATKSHTHSDYVPTTRTVNGKALSDNISLSASDVGALPSSTAIPSITYGNTDLTAGTSTLATGTYYAYYE